MYYRCPITYYTDHLIFDTEKNGWAVFRLSGYNYELKNGQMKVESVYRMAAFLGEIMSEAQLYIIPVGQNIEDHYERFRKNLKAKDELYDTALWMATETESYLKKVLESQYEVNDDLVYILVKLELSSDNMEKIKNALNDFVQQPLHALFVNLRLETEDILERKIQDCISLAEKWAQKQNYIMHIEKAESHEVQWLVRRVAKRGLKEEVELYYQDSSNEVPANPRSNTYHVNGDKVRKVRQKDTVRLFDGTVSLGERYVMVQSDNKVSYQSFLAIRQIPDDISFSGLEWLYVLQKMRVRAEICIHIKSIEHLKALAKVDGKKQEVEGQISHVTESKSKVPQELKEGVKEGNWLKDELKETRSPLLCTSIVICVAADNDKDMEDRINRIRAEYKNRHIILERPRSDQRKLYMQCMPAAGAAIADYVMILPATTLASGVIGASQTVGDDEGWFVATTGNNRKNVFHNPGKACKLNKSPASAFIGDLGVGKSFNANLLGILNVIYNGGSVFIFDPKAERAHWETELTCLKGFIKTVALSAERGNKGKLDPYNIYRKDMDKANALAVNTLVEQFAIKTATDQHTLLKEAVKRMTDTVELPCMEKLIDVLEAYSPEDDLYMEAKRMARSIRADKDVGMSILLYGNGHEEAITLENRVNILLLRGLDMPEKNVQKEDYKESERTSCAIFSVISDFTQNWCMQVSKRKRFSTVVFSEAWFLRRVSAGHALYEFIGRMGRSLNIGAIFDTHSVEDIPEDIRHAITYKFFFKTSIAAEAQRMLQWLGMEATPENIKVLMNLGNAECLFQDVYGRVGRIKFDAVFGDLIEVFSTTPEEEKEQAIEQVIKEKGEMITKCEEHGESGRFEDLEALLSKEV